MHRRTWKKEAVGAPDLFPHTSTHVSLHLYSFMQSFITKQKANSKSCSKRKWSESREFSHGDSNYTQGTRSRCCNWVCNKRRVSERILGGCGLKPGRSTTGLIVSANRRTPRCCPLQNGMWCVKRVGISGAPSVGWVCQSSFSLSRTSSAQKSEMWLS